MPKRQSGHKKGKQRNLWTFAMTDQQKPKVKGINPMALAIDIKTKEPEQPRISV